MVFNWCVIEDVLEFYVFTHQKITNSNIFFLLIIHFHFIKHWFSLRSTLSVSVLSLDRKRYPEREREQHNICLRCPETRVWMKFPKLQLYETSMRLATASTYTTHCYEQVRHAAAVASEVSCPLRFLRQINLNASSKRQKLIFLITNPKVYVHTSVIKTFKYMFVLWLALSQRQQFSSFNHI